ncbi:hypothetical protein EWM62_11460 [Mucilaginibacter terrigena]|uniref:Uncharacterized protein n=1 Tax=Mucilaginibacter terrigena TaxID=2492395 RepID=A0A4Q5LKF4_9SPHI|nr:hypothetical protein [Mucilaginibacter terrigena]RYU90151.1 hypothetical protein EWM62_11460 [Mucilaginibacter terrigena]
MRFTWLKYLCVCLCVFALLESTGISALYLIAKHHISQTDIPAANDEEGTAERSETKESNPKDFWAVNPVILPPVYVSFESVIYPPEKQAAHLAWMPPVPTPPPNS